MSLLSNYEGLRQQIEKLVRENEELKKLVRLIRENHELRSAIRSQASGLGIGGLGEGTGPAPLRQGIFLPTSPTAANQSDAGMVTLPLADMLSSSQPGPPATSIMNSVAGQLNALLSASMPVPQAAQLSSLSPGPMAVPPTSTLAMPPMGTMTTSFGLPSSGPMTPSGPMAMPTAGTLTTSLGLPSSGPLTPNSPMVVPPMGTLTTSLSLPSSGPLAPSSPPTAAPPAGTVTTSFGLTSSNPLTPSSPLLASTMAPVAVPQSLLASPLGNTVTSESTRVRLSETMRRCSSGSQASSLPASVNDARGARASETSRKSVLELERKLAHRKVSKFQESPRESRQMAWERLVGEIAFQLDRRILSSIFPERVRLYGFTVSNIPEKIIQASMSPSDHKLDEELCQTLTQRYVSIMNRLQSLGYNGRVHPALTEQLVNAYGILRERPELAASEGGCYTVDFLQHVLVETVHPGLLTDALLLLSCLSQLALDDGKPMFIW
ncbi:speriolin isoform X2 [Echinops telfairi]|uniref:Speriolin isoform X2 n=1 Tax=Echinops telfairi TaxID=9371 RepID=A0AC55CWQ7_ECHTE|nr:speriolin isoform X2 [Echinops telfairi]